MLHAGAVKLDREAFTIMLSSRNYDDAFLLLVAIVINQWTVQLAFTQSALRNVERAGRFSVFELRIPPLAAFYPLLRRPPAFRGSVGRLILPQSEKSAAWVKVVLDVRAGGLVRFDLLSVAVSPTAANLSVMTKWMSLIAHCISIGFFSSGTQK